MSEITLVSCIWAFALVLYYFAGKSKGYNDGFNAGAVYGAKEVLALLKDKSNEYSKPTVEDSK